MLNKDGSGGGGSGEGDFRGGVEVGFSGDREGGKRIRPPFFEGVGETKGIAGRGVRLVPVVKGGVEGPDGGAKDGAVASSFGGRGNVVGAGGNFRMEGTSGKFNTRRRIIVLVVVDIIADPSTIFG